jgi:ElaB/YqjD/DUF883 family membrane-anchored ribosome-binding protein
MFHRHSSAAAIEGHLRAIQNELGRIGRNAGQHGSARASAVGEQIGDAITPILNEIADRLRSGRRLAADEAARLGNEAVKIGGQFGNEAMDRIATEVEHRPFITLALAVGVGILIGIAGSRQLERRNH